MKNGIVAIAVLTVVSGGPVFAQQSVEITGETLGAAAESQDSVVIRHPYFDAYISRSSLDSPGSLAEPDTAGQFQPMLERLRVAEPWLKLLEKGESDHYWEEGQCAPENTLGRAELCGLRWRKSDGFSDLRYQLGEMTDGVKSKIVGKALSKHLEVDLDSSPEIKIQWEFD